MKRMFSGEGVLESACLAIRVSVCVQNTFCQSAGRGIKSHSVTALVLSWVYSFCRYLNPLFPQSIANNFQIFLFSSFTRVALLMLVLQYTVEFFFHLARLIYFADRQELACHVFNVFNALFVLFRLVTITLAVLTFWYVMNYLLFSETNLNLFVLSFMPYKQYFSYLMAIAH